MKIKCIVMNFKIKLNKFISYKIIKNKKIKKAILVIFIEFSFIKKT